MEEINHDLSSDLLENEKFDFDLAFSPNIHQDQINKHQELDNEEEVFFGPVGFTEQCVATRAKALQQENDIKPLSPLTGEQVVEVFKEATKLALRFEKLSSNASPVSSLSSNNSSILKLSSTGSESPSWLTGKLSSGSSDGTSFSQFELDFDKENILPLSVNNGNNFSSDKNRQIPSVINNKQVPQAMEEENIISFTNYTDGEIEQNKGNFDKEVISLSKNTKRTSAKLGEHVISDVIKETVQQSDKFNDDPEQFSNEENLNEAKNGQEKIKKSGRESEQLNGEKVTKREGIVQQDAMQNEIKSNKIPVVKARGSGLPVRPGQKTSKLPKTKNIGKSMSAFSLPISSIGSGKKRDVSTKNADAVEKNTCPTDQPSIGATNLSNSKLRKSVPAKAPQDGSKIKPRSEKTLAKRNIFNSSEASDKLATKDCKSKLPVSGSNIPASRPRRRRSNSLSSLDSSQSSASSQTSQDDNTTSKPIRSQDDNVTSKLIRPSTKIPTTKASLATRRCKLQDTTANKKPQALKALPRPGCASSNKNSKTDTKVAKAMPPPSTEQDLKEDKTPMPATPRSSSSLPVARRRSSFKSSLSSTSSREGSPPKYFTPSKPGGKMTEPKTASSTCRRRSSNPTPRSKAPSSASRRVLKSSGDESVLLSLSPASKPKSTRKTNRKLIPDNDSSSVNDACFPTQSVDDLLGCDNGDSILEDVVPIQPKPVPQADLIDLSGL